MIARTVQPALSLLLAAVTCAACQPDRTTPQGVAQLFVDRHYVRFDLEAAQAVCTGLAAHKVQEEQRLRRGVAIDESTRQPTVRYRLREKKEDAEHATFVFDGTVHVDGADSFTTEWIITVRRIEGVWKVSNFSERSD